MMLNIFLYVIWPLGVLLGDMSLHVFCLFLNCIGYVFIVEFGKYFFIFNICPLPNMWFPDRFSQSGGCLFIPLPGSFAEPFLTPFYVVFSLSFTSKYISTTLRPTSFTNELFRKVLFIVFKRLRFSSLSATDSSLIPLR